MIPLKDDIPSARLPFVTIALVAINCLVYLYLKSLGGEGYEKALFRWGTIPYEISHGTELNPEMAFYIPLTLFTAMFLHGGFLHLAGNMLYLWIFGDNIEDRLGHVKFFIFYILSGLAASLLFVLTSPQSQIPMVGASGAIAGVLGAYMITFPKARILTLVFFGFFIRVTPIPALFLLGFWFLFQLLYALPSIGSTSSGVAFFAHVGGFLAGIVLFKILTIFSKKRYYYA
jgi:membrane associated rhomboid family serine protease